MDVGNDSDQLLSVNPIFNFLTMVVGEKHTFDTDPTNGKPVLVSSIGTKDISHGSANYGIDIVHHRMKTILQKAKEGLPNSNNPITDEDIQRRVDITRSGLHLAALKFNMLSLHDEELMFQLHPTKIGWLEICKNMYGENSALILQNIFDLRCSEPVCNYTFRYYTHIRDHMGKLRSGPCILPMFIRDGLMTKKAMFVQDLKEFLSFVTENNYVFPKLCIVCFMMKHMCNAFRSTLTMCNDRPQISLLGLFEIYKPDAKDRFIREYISTHEHAACHLDDLLDVEEHHRSLHVLETLPFDNIEIAVDKENINGYTVRWKEHQ